MRGVATSQVATDGRGGVWLASFTGFTATGKAWFCHDINGHWTKAVVPVHAGEQPSIDNLAWIPGTGSLWATGSFQSDAGTAILKHEP